MVQVCRVCGEEKNMSEFYAHHTNKTGVDSRCKSCSDKYAAEYRKTNRAAVNAKKRELEKRKETEIPGYLALKAEKRREYLKTHPRHRRTRGRTKEEDRARYHKKHPHRVASQLVRNAVKTGTIVKPSNCSRCGEFNTLHGHHEDYSRPLDVVWLCGPCHRDVHRNIPVATV